MRNLTNLKQITEVAVTQIEQMVEETGLDWEKDLAPNELYEMLLDYSQEFNCNWTDKEVKQVVELIYG